MVATESDVEALEAQPEPRRIALSLTLNQRKFLAAYVACGTVTHAAQSADLHRNDHYRWLEESEDYAAAFIDAHESTIDQLERAARIRAIDGVVRYVTTQAGLVEGPDGKPLEERIYSDSLLSQLLKGRRHKIFGDRRHVEITGKDGGPIEILGKIESELSRISGRGEAEGIPQRLLTG